MNANQFDTLARRLVDRTTRRGVLGGLVVGALAQAPARVLGVVTCLENGKRCHAGSDCCSGVCKRKRKTHKRFCRAAPHQGICTIASDACSFTGVPCSVSSGSDYDCQCYVTPAGRSFCGSNGCYVMPCKSDAECASAHGAGSVCWPAGTPCCGGSTGCIPPCPDPA